MKINNFILLSLAMLLQGCIGMYRTGAVIPDNWGERKTIPSGGYSAKVSINTNDKVHVTSNDKTILINLPHRIRDGRCKYMTGFIIPFYFSDDCGNSWTTTEHMLGISLTGDPYTLEFMNNLQISFVSNGVEYIGSKSIGKDNKYAYFSYPVQISVLEKGNHYLNIKYKGFAKHIPIIYKMEWN